MPHGITSVRPRRSWANVVNSGRHETRSRASSVFDRDEVRLGYCLMPYQRLWLYNGAPLVAFYDTLGIRRTYSRLKPPQGRPWRVPRLCPPHQGRPGRDEELSRGALSGGTLGGVRKVWIPPRAALVGMDPRGFEGRGRGPWP